MAAEALPFTTPVGRFVSGSLTEQNKHEYDSKAPNFRGKELPPEKHHYWFGVAFRKDQVGGSFGDMNGLLTALFQHAWKGYSQNPAIIARLQSGPMDPHSTFAWKISDGDEKNADGSPKYPNAVGCWVLGFRTNYPVKCANGLQNNAECDASVIERGYYVDVHASAKINEQTDHTAGIYLNPLIVRLVGYGEKISGGPSIAQAFGSAPLPQLPPGASAVPLAGAMPSPTPPPAAAAPMPPGYAPAAGAMPAMPGAAGYGAPQPAPVMPAPTASHGEAPQHPTFVPGYAPQPQAMPSPTMPGTAGGPPPLPLPGR